MARTLKIVVTGPFGAGKTEFVKTISDIPVVTTERKISTRQKEQKLQTTVAMDYGRVEINGDIVHLTGTPGQARFDFMWEILSREMNGLVLLVDATDDGSFAEARLMLDEMLALHPVPYVIAANKQDQSNALTGDKLRHGLGLGHEALVMPCVATQKTSIKLVLSQLTQAIG